MAGTDTEAEGGVETADCVLWAGDGVAAGAAVALRVGEEVEAGSLGRHVGLARLLCWREPEGDCWNSDCLPGAPEVEGVVAEEGAAVAAAVLAGDCVWEGEWALTCWGGGVGCGLPCTILLYDVAVVVELKAGRVGAAAEEEEAAVEGGVGCWGCAWD